MRWNILRMMWKNNVYPTKVVDENSFMWKEKVKTLVKWSVLASLILFFLLFYVPQVNLGRKTDVMVQGWGVNTSRALALYVLPYNETILIFDSQLCADSILLLIIVCSAVNNTAERNTIRETWGNFSTRDFKLVFLLGTTDNATLQEAINDESVIHSDIIQENFIDSYNNLTLKSVMLLKYVSMHCDRVEYILKCDDDMFIHVENLVLLVRTYHTKKVMNVLVGELICDAKPILDTTSKWYSPRYMYEGRVYPHYLSGTGYLMDRHTVHMLYNAALVTPFFHLEDVYITGLCARKAKIKPRHNPGFSYLTRPLDPCLYLNRNVITSHRVTMSNMRELWQALQNQSFCTDATATSSKLRQLKKSPKLKKAYRCS